MACKGKRVLITSGPTAVAVDAVRVISNRSTGEMGRLIAKAFSRMGARVTLLEGRSATSRLALSKTIALKKFFYYDELDRLLTEQLAHGFDIVIHAAAVSDLKPARLSRQKISSASALRLDLVPTKKLVNKIKRMAPGVFLIGFKLETRLSPRFILNKAKDLFNKAHCDLVLANMYAKNDYAACLIEPSGYISAKVFSKEAIVNALVRKIEQEF